MEKLHQHKATLGISETKRGSKHAKTALGNARYTSPVDPTYMNLNSSVKPVRQSRQHEKAITGWSDAKVKKASVQPTILHRMIRPNQLKMSVQLSRDTSKWTTEHRLNRRIQLQNAGAVVQRNTKTKCLEHRLNRYLRKSIRRWNEQDNEP